MTLRGKSALDQLDARAFGALLLLGAFDGRYAAAWEVANVTGNGDGRLWAPKLRRLREAGLVELDAGGQYTITDAPFKWWAGW